MDEVLFLTSTLFRQILLYDYIPQEFEFVSSDHFLHGTAITMSLDTDDHKLH